MNSAMEQTRYWMWARKKLNNNNTTRPPPPLFNSPLISSSSSYHESWEEQAFAEDSAGLLGGCIWPPRSYSCSFCRREFRSAQALGGHMNVHRRDRARLKQSSSPIDEDQVGSMEYYTPNPNNPSPSPNPNPNSGAIGSSSLPSFVNPMPLRLPSALELRLELGSFKVREVGSKGKRDWDEDDEIDAYSSNKRQRSDQQLGFPSIVKPSSGDFHFVSRSTEVLKLSPSPVEEIDLELRLGDPPKVK